MPVRNTQSGAEAAVQGGATVRETQSGIEAALQGGSAMRVTQSGIEVLTEAPPPGAAGTCAVASGTLGYRLRVRNAADDADELVITSLAGGPNPYILKAPDGDGQAFDPLTGHSDIGAYTCQVIDAITTGTDRVVTEVLADASGRYQLLSRRAFIEESDDDGGSWTVLVAGYVNRCALGNALTYEFTIGEARRAEKERKLFVQVESPFDRVSNIIGTPIRGGFGPMPDFGGWKFSVTDVQATFVELEFLEGWTYDPQQSRPVGTGTGLFGHTFGQLADPIRLYVNESANAYGVRTDPSNFDGLVGSYPRLTAHVEQADGTTLGSFTPFMVVDHAVGSILPTVGMLDVHRRMYLDWTVSQPTPGDEVFVWINPIDIDERNPLHLTGHPVDLVAQAFTLAGITYDAAAHALTKSAIGDDAFVSLRLTRSMSVAAFTDMLGGLYGFTTRFGTDGEYEFLPTRAGLTAPTTTISKACLRGEGEPFALEESTIVNVVTVRHQLFDAWIDSDAGERPFDNVKVIAESVTTDNGETAVHGEHPVEYQLEGRIETRSPGQLITQSGDPIQGAKFDAWVTTLGRDMFARYGRGADEGILELLRGEHVQIGDVLMLDLDYVPSGNVRGGQKIVQVTQATVFPDGIDAKIIALGVNLQPATVPTFTIVASSLDPRHVADLAVTNAGSLPAGAIVRVEWAVGASITSGTLLALLDIDAGETTVSTPQSAAGTIVSARMRVELASQVPGAWSGWQSVTLTGLAAPTGLAAVAVDAQSYDLSWTNTETDVTVEILLRLASEPDFSAATRRLPFFLLPPGSTQFRITGLTTGVAYVAGVRYREGAPLFGLGAIVTVNLNPSGTAPTLTAPTSPVAWAGRVDAAGVRVVDGTFGMDVIASVLPSKVEFDVATETAIGSGTYGSFTLAGTIDSVSGSVTRFQANAANDGLRRALRARHVRAGSIASAYTSTVTVDPWSVSSPGAPTDAEVLTRAVSSAFPNARVVVDGDVAADFATPGQVTFYVSDAGRTIVALAQFGDGVAQPNINARAGCMLPFDLDVLGWTIWADASGAAEVDVRRATVATIGSTGFVSIAGTELPTLAAQIVAQDLALTTWTADGASGLELDADDLLDFQLQSLTTCKLVMVALKCRRRIA
jgi:hypothetical protein